MFESIKKAHAKLTLLAYRRFVEFVGISGGGVTKSLFKLFVFACYAVLTVFLVNLFAIGKSSFGEWGDFFGGVLNPILTFLTFMGLLLTIVLQNRELRETRAEAKRTADALVRQNKVTDKQSFEQTLFNMLSLHQQILGAIDIYNKESKQTTLGRDCINVFFERYKKVAENVGVGRGYQYIDETSETSRLDRAWRSFWGAHKSELGHYFRFLYNIIRFIDDANVEKTTYIRIVRSQLSDQELALLFYNCLSEHGREKFKPLVERYALFDNLPQTMLLRKEHLNLYKQSAYE
ncbi:putative phage abortive infection protein [Vibrio vulnificus]|uniref:putative phage abortive infection protein n=1 Tax=Vibrio vulnificus TaxID=672 RepID=UPI003ED9C986